MVGCVAKEINTEPHSLALKKKSCSVSGHKGNKAGYLRKIKYMPPSCLSCFGGAYSLPWKDMSPWTMGSG